MSIFSRNVINIWGDEGRGWLESLPSLVDELAAKWDLDALKPLSNLSFNYVLSGTRKTDHVPIILKLSADAKGFNQELAALNFYEGQGCVRLVEVEHEKKAMLLEKIEPGIPLKAHFPQEDELTVSVAVQVMQKLHARKPVDPSGFPTVSEWLKPLERKLDLPQNHLKKAQSLSKKLLETSAEPVLLHGDLHHENILSSKRDGWLAIDPKGVLGEPAYEVGAFIRNPMPELLDQVDVSKIIAHRLALFADLLKMDRERLKDWCYVITVLSACWSREDGMDPSYDLSVAELIEAA